MNASGSPPSWQDNMFRQFLNPPNWFTAASMFCGMYAIVLAVGLNGDPDFYRAGLMILFAGVFDTIDGGVARLTKTGSDFGIQLDSLVDVVSFGVAPAFLLYAWGASAFGTLGLVIAFFYALCATFRLARFNTKADGSKSAWNEGLAVTMAGAGVASAVMAHSYIDGNFNHSASALLIAILLSILMVSSVPYRGWKTLRLRGRDLFGVALTLGFTLVMAVRVDISWAFFLGSIVYVGSGPVEALFTRRWRVSDHDDLQVAGVRISDD
ncbi:MAG: CDP-diacylglycerol--serine O-phosphatidyltransferase [Deltaproteobacteria bacterium]|nr:CDP-diacylglycerol--serine O-phosphatidyltransferase [Deltaproteobacteria bacterium]